MKTVRIPRRLLAVTLAGSLSAQAPPDPIQDPAAAPDLIRVWGDTAMLATLLAWEADYHVLHPEVRFANRLLGTDTGMGALYNHRADLALFGRETTQTEDDGFLHTLQYRPVQLRLTMGSLDTPEQTPAPVVLVARDNPLQSLTLAQLQRALGCGLPGVAPALTWSDLGATGAWAARPLHVYTFDESSGTGTFVLRRVQGASRKMNWAVVHEFHDLERSTGELVPAARQTAEALRQDPDGLALSILRYAGPSVRAVPLSDAGAPVMATAQTVSDASYPFARSTYIAADRPPGGQLPAQVLDFLRYLLGVRGQALMMGRRSYLPLPTSMAAAELNELR